MDLGIMPLEERIVLDAAVLADHDQPEAPEPTPTQTGLDIVLIADNLPDYQQLIEAARDTATVVVVDADADTAREICDRLGGLARDSATTIDSISILSHGGSGWFELGSDVIETTTLAQTVHGLHDLGAVLSPDADLRLYSCAVGDGDRAQTFLDQMAHVTGADVFASNDLTGPGGDWDLEMSSTGAVWGVPGQDAGDPLDLARLQGYSGNLLNLTNGLLVYYSFDTDNGGSVTDNSGNGVTGLITGGDGDEWNAGGHDGGALQLETDADIVQIGSTAAAWDLPSYTISGWFNTTDASEYRCLTSRTLGSTNRTWWVAVWKDTGNLVFKMSSSGNGETELSSGFSVIDGQWHHFVATFEENTAAKLYVDGQLRASDTTVGTPSYPGVQAVIGEDTGQGGRQYNGLLDEFRIHNRALSQSEVTALYTDHLPPEILEPAEQETEYDTPLTFSTVNGNAILIEDGDPGETIRLTLDVGHGGLTLGTTAGLTILDGDGDGHVVFEGSEADVNAALQGLVYSPTSGYVGIDTLAIHSHDGTIGDSASITLRTVHQNGPTTQANNALSINRDQPTAITSALLRFTDTTSTGDPVAAGNVVYTVTSNVAEGQLGLDLDGDGLLDVRIGTGSGETLTFTQADIDSSWLVYDPQGTELSSLSFGFAVRDFDGPHDMVGLSFTINSTLPRLVAHYKFDNPADLGVDSTGHFAATPSGFDGNEAVDGLIDGALRLDGNNELLKIGTVNDLALESYTIAGWFRTSAKTDYHCITSRNISSGDRTWWIAVWPTSGVLTWRSSGNGLDLNTGVDVADNQWHHFATVLNPGTGAYLYLDGALVAQQLGVGGPGLPGTQAIIGRDPTNPGRYFQGDLDDMRFYSGALAASDIEALAAIPPGITTSGGSSAFVEDSGAVFVDSSLSVAGYNDVNLAGAVIKISDHYAAGEDALLFSAQNGITGTWNATTGTLTLSGTASVAAYQEALRSVRYDNASDNPDLSTRTVSFRVSDGTTDSTVVSRAVTVAAVNDAPVVVRAEGLIVGEAGTVTLGADHLLLSDVDTSSADLVYVLRLAPEHGELRVDGRTIIPEGTFSQADVDAGRVVFAYDGSSGTDSVLDLALLDLGTDAGSVQVNVAIPREVVAELQVKPPADVLLSDPAPAAGTTAADVTVSPDALDNMTTNLALDQLAFDAREVGTGSLRMSLLQDLWSVPHQDEAAPRLGPDSGAVQQAIQALDDVRLPDRALYDRILEGPFDPTDDNGLSRAAGKWKRLFSPWYSAPS